MMVTNLVKTKNADVLCLSETDTEDYENYKSLNVDGYTVMHSKEAYVHRPEGAKRREKRKKVRSIMLVKNGLFTNVEQITRGVGERAEVWAELTNEKGDSFIVVAMYQEWFGGRVAGRDNDGLIKMARKVANKRVVLIGDFNTSATQPEPPEYIQELKLLGYDIRHAGPTFTFPNGESAIDYAVTNMEEVEDLEKSEELMSDHKYIQLRVPVNITISPEWYKRRDKKALYTEKSLRMLREKFPPSSTPEDLEGVANHIVKSCAEHMDEVAPERTRTAKREPIHKLSSGVRRAKRAYQRALRDGREKAFKRNKNRYYQEIRKSKANQIKYEISKYGPKAMWKLRKKRLEPPEQAIAVRDEHGKPLDDKQAADALMEVFIAKVKKARPDSDQDEEEEPQEPDPKDRSHDMIRVAIPEEYQDDQVKNEARTQYKEEQQRRLEEEQRELEKRNPRLVGMKRLELEGTKTEDEVRKLVASLKNSEAPDHMGISQRDFKNLCEAMITPLTKMVNLSLTEGKFPDALKTARIKPIPKPGKCKKNLNSYRPISLLAPAGKLLELTVKQIIVDFANKYGLLPRGQHGYRPQRSCITAVAEALKEIDRRRFEKKKTGMVLFDFSCAFDLVQAGKLVEEMKLMGFGASVIRWVKSYLHSRRAYVEVNGKMSEVVVLDTGTPQGSIISPLLFVVLIARMGNNFDGILIGYADDSTNVLSADTMEELREKMIDSIKRMQRFAENMGMALNVDKTEFIYFGGKKMPDIKVGNIEIAESKTVKFLGTHLNKNLNGKAQIDVIRRRVALETRYMMKLKLSFESRKAVALGVIHPIITADLATWTDPMKEGGTSLAKLQVIWNNASRATIGYNASKRLPVEELMKIMGTRLIRDEALHKLSKFMYLTIPENFEMHYLSTYECDHKKRQRPGRIEKLFVYPDGISAVNKARKLWNLLKDMNQETILYLKMGNFERTFNALIGEIKDRVYRKSNNVRD